MRTLTQAVNQIAEALDFEDLFDETEWKWLRAGVTSASGTIEVIPTDDSAVLYNEEVQFDFMLCEDGWNFVKYHLKPLDKVIDAHNAAYLRHPVNA